MQVNLNLSFQTWEQFLWIPLSSILLILKFTIIEYGEIKYKIILNRSAKLLIIKVIEKKY